MFKDKRLSIIFLIIFVNLLGFGIILPLLPYYAESFGATPMTIGWLMAAFSLCQFIASPILGELSDKFGRRPILLFSIGGTALSFLLLGVARTLPMLFLSRIIDGISGGNISTAQAYIADITNKENRTQGMGVMMAAFSLGFILGPAIGGLLSVYGYGVPAFAAGVVAVVATFLTWKFLPESRNPDVESIKRKRFFSLSDFYDALTHPNIGRWLSISFLIMLAFSLMQGTFALFSEHTLGLTAKDNGIIFAYLGIIGVIIQIWGLKWILKKWGEPTITVATIFGMAISLAMMAYSPGWGWLIAAITLMAGANNISGPVLAGLMSKATPDNEQGNMMGMNQAVGSIARLVGPVAGTFIYSQFSPRAPYLLAAGILAVTGVYSAVKLKR